MDVQPPVAHLRLCPRASRIWQVVLIPSYKIRVVILLSRRDINQQDIKRLNYGAEIVWLEVEKDEQEFLSFIDGVLDVLELPEAPEHSPNCQWCSYISKLNST